jgi:hypothetical protein
MHACRRAHMEHPYRTENGSENESTAAVPRAHSGGVGDASEIRRGAAACRRFSQGRPESCVLGPAF